MNSGMNKEVLIEGSGINAGLHVRPIIQCLVGILLGLSSLYLYSFSPALTVLVFGFAIGLLISGTFFRPQVINN